MFSFFKRLAQKPAPAHAPEALDTPAAKPGDLRQLGSASNDIDAIATTLAELPSSLNPAEHEPGQSLSRPMLSEAEAKRVLKDLPDPLELLALENPHETLELREHDPYANKSAKLIKKPTPLAAQPGISVELDSSFDKLLGDDKGEESAAEFAAPPVVSTPFYLRLKAGLKRTGDGITSLFVGTQIDDELYDDLEGALLMADAGTAATQYLLDDLKQRVKTHKTRDPKAVRTLLELAIADLLKPLEAPLEIGRFVPTVMMVAGVNGAGKTTTIGKLTHHFQSAGLSVILAAGDTFRAAAKEQLAVWADRTKVTIISRDEGDPASVIFDAVQSGIAKKTDVVIADTAGRLPTQMHLMDELKKIQRTISKAQGSAPHEVVLVLDGNTGQNALAQVKAFDDALSLTGLVITKLDGTARGGVLCGIARYAALHAKRGKLPVYFIGVGEKLEDLQPFNAAQFAKALVG
jgi:fused signal recognition particle receptor